MEAPGIELSREASAIVGTNDGLPEKTSATRASEATRATTVSVESEPPVPESERPDVALTAAIKAAVDAGDDALAVELLSIRKARRARMTSAPVHRIEGAEVIDLTSRRR